MIDKIIIESYNPKYSEDFKNLNLEWIKEFFKIEEEDLTSLNNPSLYFLDQGGEIFFALIDDKVIGTAAMAHKSMGLFELAKMAVNREYRGHGIGRLLLNNCLKFAKEKKAKEVFLITNDSLKPALNLYRSCGFELNEQNDDNRYERGNTKMNLILGEK